MVYKEEYKEEVRLVPLSSRQPDESYQTKSLMTFFIFHSIDSVP